LVEEFPLNTLKVGICGLGTVGSGTVNVLQRNGATISARAGVNIEIVHIGARRDNPLCDISSYKVSRDIFEVVRDPEVDLVIELIGGTTIAKDLVIEALKNGKHVVTANKALIAMYGNELLALAAEQGVTVAFEAAVAGGIPIIKAVREGVAANEIKWLAGIINGTGNFILTEMRDKGRDFADVLAEAQALGYAEADPTFDVEGIDAAHKLVILASLAFGMPFRFEKCFTEGIAAIDAVDVKYAEELGYRIKHLGIARRCENGIELRVHPTLIPEKRLIANVNGVMNAVLVNGDASGPTLYYGAGAGADATASSVIADVVDIARGNQIPMMGFAAEEVSKQHILPIEEVETAFYLRISADDKPGVLSEIATVLSSRGISIEAIIQKEAPDDEVQVPIIILTSRTLESKMIDAVRAIENFEFVQRPLVRVRVESLAG
jgi:homoserine dehydrogenase